MQLQTLIPLPQAESAASDDSEIQVPVHIEDAYIDGNAQVGGNIDNWRVLLIMTCKAPNSKSSERSVYTRTVSENPDGQGRQVTVRQLSS